MGSAKMGSGLMFRGRLNLTPTKIKGLPQLKSILSRARELEVVL